MLYKKLKIKPGHKIGTHQAPSHFCETLSPLPKNVKIYSQLKENIDAIHWFVKNQAELEKDLKFILDKMTNEMIVWIYYPKGSSGVQTDLTRDKGWESLLSCDVHFLSLISFDDTWSAFAFRNKTDADRKKELLKPKEREIFKYADPATKTVRLPKEMEQVLNKNKQAKAIFDSLSFTQRKEYVEWIISAKREETKAKRLKELIVKVLNNSR